MPEPPSPRRSFSWWRSWRREERREPLRPVPVIRALALALLALGPLLALHAQRRATEIQRERQAQRDDTLALMEASLASAERNARDWGHWDDAYRFARGLNPGYPASMEASSIFQGGTVQILLRPDGSTLLVHAAPAFRPSRSTALERCVRDNRRHLSAISSTVRLACRSDDGSLYLGAATPVSDDTATAAAAGTLAMLEPLQKPEYSAAIRERLSQLSRELRVLPQEAQAVAGLERIQPPVRSSHNTVLSLPAPSRLADLLSSLGRDLPLLLAIPALALILRVLSRLERRRQRLGERRVEQRTNRRIRSTCRQLDRLMTSLSPAEGSSGNQKAILERLTREGEAADPAAEAPRDPAAAPLERVSRRFEHFLTRASELALHDALTKLPNRRFFIEQLTARVQSSDRGQEPLAVLFIDVDRFKFINDTYGHAVGDAVLIEVSRRLQEVLQAGDFMARYGGDELAVILDLSDSPAPSPGAHDRAARERAEAMITALREPLRIDDLVIAVSLSIGIALVESQEREITALIQRSDLAMYQAKRSRGSRIVGPGEMVSIPQLSSYQLFSDLIAAVRQRQLEVVFQPICDAGGRRFGMEALARWRHPERGWIPPELFLQMAELHRQMRPVGEELIRISLAGFRRLQRQDPALRLYLNLSASQLLDPDLAATLLGNLEREGLSARQLVIELTEHAMLEPSSSAESNLEALRRSGCLLALDDFGSGYSSLGMLIALRPDLVKIDRSLIQAMDGDNDAAHIVRMIASLAPELGMELVAEGIEDRRTIPALSRLGIQRFQGYGLGRPASAACWLEPQQADQSAASSRSIV